MGPAKVGRGIHVPGPTYHARLLTCAAPMRFALILFVLVAIALALMATQSANTDWVGLALPYTDITLRSPLILMVASSLGIGFLLGYLSGLPARIGAGRRARQAEQQLAKVAPATATGVAPTATSGAGAAETASIADDIARRTAAVQRDVPPRV